MISFAGLALDIGFIAQPFYAWAWWSMISLIDGFVARRRQSSLLTGRRRHFPMIALWSVTFWYFFELLNLRLQNWYYVGVFGTETGIDVVRAAVFGILAFATVFVGLFEVYDALGALNLWGRASLRPREFPRWFSYAVQAVGMTMVTLALTFSTLAPLVWGSFSFLVDPWNYRRGARSVLADIESGRVTGLLRLLGAGLVCGLIWESFNFLAPQKWIYTVRGLEELKLFEMPLLGFLGFPALALDAFAAYAAVSFLWLGNTTWEHPDDVAHVRLASVRAVGRPRLIAAVPVHVAFWVAVSILGQNTNVGSIELRLGHLETLPSEAVEALAPLGIHRPRQLLRRMSDASERERVRDALGLSRAMMTALDNEIELMELKGIGPHHGALLRELGVRTLSDLARASPDQLYRELVKAKPSPFPGLRVSMVRVWTREAARRQ